MTLLLKMCSFKVASIKIEECKALNTVCVLYKWIWTLQCRDCIFKLSANTTKLFILGAVLPEHLNQYIIVFVDMLHLPTVNIQVFSIGRWESSTKEKEVDFHIFIPVFRKVEWWGNGVFCWSSIANVVGLAWKPFATLTSLPKCM